MRWLKITNKENMMATRGREGFLIIVVIAAVAFVLGCEKPPTQEIIRAEKARDEAKQKKADFYVPDLFAKAEESLMRSKILAARKQYKEARKVAEEAERFAHQSIALVESNREKMKAEAEQMLRDVLRRLDEFKIRVAKAIEKKMTIDEQELQRTIDTWETRVVAIKDELQRGEIGEARDLLKSLLDELTDREEHFAKVTEPKRRKK
jgi:hypothetical protein